ncbi:MAG: aminotransferase class V-fold PLP-dependent enzyme, partial [Bacillota bacterium]
LLAPGETLLVHEAPVYPTTETTIKAMGLTVVRVDLNDLQKVRAVAEETQPKLALIQHTRQRFADSYDVGQVIQAITEKAPRTIVAVDENYAAFKVPRLGCQLGADISTFSLFKLLGPEGVGCVIGRKVLIDKVRAINYSGGSQVQGPEAMEALRSLVFVPVIQAVQGEVVEEIVRRLNAGEVPGVAQACAANAEERIVLVQFTEPVAEKVLEYAWRYGAAPYPVGSESRYEVAPMFYRVSATFLTENPSLGQTTIRVNPMRAGADTVIRILNKVLAEATH